MFILERDGRAAIARRPIRVEISAKNGAGSPLPEGDVLLAARHGDVAAPEAMSPRPSILTLRTVDVRTVLRVQPGHARTLFPEGTSVTLTVRTTRTRDAEEDLVVVRDMPVSGLPFRDLLIMEVLDEQRLDVSAIALVEDRPLGPLAAAARNAARHRLGVERSTEAKDVFVGIDMSTSMWSAFRDGSIEAVLDVVAGVAEVIGPDRDLRVWLLAEEPILLPPAERVQLADATMRAIVRTGLGCGFRPVPPGFAAAVTFVITDAVPPDAAAMRAALARGEDRRIVVLDGGRPSPRSADLPTAWLGPPTAGVAARDRLLQQPDLLAGLVGGMVRVGAVGP